MPSAISRSISVLDRHSTEYSLYLPNASGNRHRHRAAPLSGLNDFAWASAMLIMAGTFGLWANWLISNALRATPDRCRRSARPRAIVRILFMSTILSLDSSDIAPRSSQLLECCPQLGREQLRLLPRGEMAALVDLVEVDEVAIGALG